MQASTTRSEHYTTKFGELHIQVGELKGEWGPARVQDRKDLNGETGSDLV